MSYRCCVPGCKSTNKTVNFYNFPSGLSDTHRYYAWLRVVNNPKLWTLKRKIVLRSQRVCALHFSDDQVITAYNNRQRLKQFAVPNLKLGTRGADTQQHQTQDGANNAAENKDNDSILCEFLTLPGSQPYIPGKGRKVITCNAGNVFTGIKAKNQTKAKSAEPFQYSIKDVAYFCELSPSGNPIDDTDEAPCNDVEILANGLVFEDSNEIQNSSPDTAPKKTRKRVTQPPKKENADALQVDPDLLLQKTADHAELLKSVAPLVTEKTLNFITNQLCHPPRDRRGIRFTQEELTESQKIWKLSSKLYKTLREKIILPSKQTLLRQLSPPKLGIGINPKLLESFQKKVDDMLAKDRYAVLMWDEMPIKPSLNYNEALDKMEGFEDLGCPASPKIATHALVFMLVGAQTHWEQPLGYYFTSGIKKSDLMRTIKLCISTVTNTGITVISTVCDQHVRNVRAIKSLCAELINRGIVPLYNPPQLLKSLRNIWLNHDVQFEKDHEWYIGTWRDVVQIYENDFADPCYKFLPKLTETHVYPDKINRRKTKYAAHTLSHSVAVALKLFAYRCKPEYISDTYDGTSEFVMFFDNLFDSVNGAGLSSDKPLRRAVTPTSEHHLFWQTAIERLQNVQFQKNFEIFVPPCIKNWIVTLERIQVLAQNVFKMNIESITMRTFNLDYLQNFFGRIRLDGVKNVCPETSAFEQSFKTLVFADYEESDRHSSEDICLDDVDRFIHSFEFYFDANWQKKFKYGEIEYRLTNSFFRKSTCVSCRNFFRNEKLVPSQKKCEQVFFDELVDHDYCEPYIRFPEYSLPHEPFSHLVHKLCQVGDYFLPLICNQQMISQKLKQICLLLIDIKFPCYFHNLLEPIVESFVPMFIGRFKLKINYVLACGRISSHSPDDIQRQAANLFTKIKPKSKVQNVKTPKSNGTKPKRRKKGKNNESTLKQINL